MVAPSRGGYATHGEPMGLIRILLIVLLIWVAWRLLRQALLPGPGKSSNNTDSGDSPTRMVRCAQCGVHLPEQEAVHKDELFFCGKEHLLEWQQDKDD